MPAISNTPPQQLERKEHGGIYGWTSAANGRSRGYIDCPFCLTAVLCYIWSLAGGGKKCTCGAILYRTAAVRRPR